MSYFLYFLLFMVCYVYFGYVLLILILSRLIQRKVLKDYRLLPV